MTTTNPAQYISQARQMRNNSAPSIDHQVVDNNVLTTNVPFSKQLTPRTIMAATGLVYLLSTLGLHHYKPSIVMENDESNLNDKVSIPLALLGGFGISSIFLGILLMMRYIFDKNSKTIK